MNRYRWIVYLGTAVLALTAADLMVQDFESSLQIENGPGGRRPLTLAGPPGPSGSAVLIHLSDNQQVVARWK